MSPDCWSRKDGGGVKDRMRGGVKWSSSRHAWLKADNDCQVCFSFLTPSSSLPDARHDRPLGSSSPFTSSVRRSISTSLRWSHSHATEVTRHCYIINVRACDCSLLAGRWPTSPFPGSPPHPPAWLSVQTYCAPTTLVTAVGQKRFNRDLNRIAIGICPPLLCLSSWRWVLTQMCQNLVKHIFIGNA